ncbi:MAG: HNH endonuclease [Candidatus Methylomirabilia bacterium]
MAVLDPGDRGAIALAEKIFMVLHEGRFTATYKYAVLLGLMDLCFEKRSRAGMAPDAVTTRELAGKMVEIYWPHSAPYQTGSGLRVLKQGGGGRDSQAEILAAIVKFRQRSSSDPSSPLAQARANAQGPFDGLINFVEWKLIQMPLPRLQVIGNLQERFLYTLGWDQDVRRKDVTRYQEGHSGPFDNRILLRPGVAHDLVQLNRLLRPLIHRKWALKVAQMNRLEESRLEEFLFGVDRIPTDAVRPGLQQIQHNSCFYCGDLLRRATGWRPEVDHFIPWARYPDNGIENLVVSHERCNHYKRDFLAADEHVARWRVRFERGSPLASDVRQIAEDTGWERNPDRTFNVARAMYLGLHRDAKLWLCKDEFVAVNMPALVQAFEGPGG